MNKKQKKMLLRISITAVMLIILNVFSLPLIINLALFLCAYVLISYDIIKKVWKAILNRRPFDENFLMAVATIGAFSVAVYNKSGDYNEAVAVMLFYQIGELFESYAVGKSRKNISALMDIRPDYANIEEEGQLKQIDPNEVEIGSIIVVQPGEKIPIDGIVVEGMSSLNTSALTGESLPREVKEGDEVISGCISMSGVLRIRTTKAFEESTVSKILELVENASSRKSKSEEFISKFARIYTPAVVYSALALAILPPIIRMLILGQVAMWSSWIYRALTFLVISCPCALVISIPLSFFAGLGGASHEGILIKGSNYLETLSKTKTVVFDKTGTLTKGVFEVVDIIATDKEKVLEYAALAESYSVHPISKSLSKAYGRELDRARVADVKEISGHGVCAVIDGHKVAAGNMKLMKSLGFDVEAFSATGTVVYVAIDEKYEGLIVISDVVKEVSKKAIDSLKEAGIEKTVMLTGDSGLVASKVANELGLDEYHSELLPADKVSKVEELIEKYCGQNKKLAFVGDGINDAPVLTRADIGIAMGAMGSDAAIEAADVVLMDDDPLKIVNAIKISRKCLSIVYQNIIFALAVKGACLILGALGLAGMWAAVFADVGVMVLAVLNAIRALRVKNL